MQQAIKSLQNNALSALTSRAPAHIIGAIQTASAKTGVDFAYLTQKAAAESNFDAGAKAKTSSATGLFQFIESTWMSMVKQHGEKYGIDPSQSRQSLLNLRKDPQISSYMAAEFAKDNKASLEKTVGGDIGNTELYFAHFMGAGGASAFLNQLKKNPMAIGSDLFPKEANANRGVFYDSKSGQPKTLHEIYAFFDKKFDPAPSTQLATNTAQPQNPLNPNNLSPNQISSDSVVRVSSDQKRGYQHIPPSLNKPIVEENYAQRMGSIYRMQNQLDAYFNQPAVSMHNNAPLPASLYSNLSSPTSLLLSLLQ